MGKRVQAKNAVPQGFTPFGGMVYHAVEKRKAERNLPLEGGIRAALYSGRSLFSEEVARLNKPLPPRAEPVRAAPLPFWRRLFNRIFRKG